MYNPLNKTYAGKTAQPVSNVMGSYNVPKMCPQESGVEGINYPPALNTLSHGVQPEHRHGGYFSILGAYPMAGCNTCKASRTTRPCAGVIDCGNAPVAEAVVPEVVKQEVEQAKKEAEKEVIESYKRRMRMNRRRRF